MKPILFSLTLLIATSSLLAQSNSKGKDSPLVIGKITAVSEDGQSITILHQGEHSREVALPKSGIQYVSVPADQQKPTIGFSAKAAIKGGSTKKLQLTLPIPEHQPLGEERASLSMEQIFAMADRNSDGKIDYIEMATSLYHSAKHGPDRFAKADKDKDGFLDLKELTKVMSEVSWWKYSRKTTGEWFAMADDDENGTLTKAEFLTICAGKSHVDNHFKRTDKDKNGTLSPQEVASYVGKMGAETDG